MRRKIESAVRNPAFSRTMLSLLGAETVTVFFCESKRRKPGALSGVVSAYAGSDSSCPYIFILS